METPNATVVAPLPSGSAAWNNAADYDAGDELHTRAISFEKHVKWNLLCEVATSIRGGMACHIGTNFSIGHFNMVREVIFSDGTRMVARLRLPELREFFGGREALDPVKSMESEIATMKLLKYTNSTQLEQIGDIDKTRLRTNIPVPEVYHFDLDTKNDVGAPYILMSYIDGNLASDQCLMLGCPPNQYGTPSQDLNFRKQVARIQAELASLTFDKIGAVYQDSDDFVIGPELQTGLGPWNNPLEYYRDVSQHLINVATEEADPEVKEAEAFTAVPKLFERLMAVAADKEPREKQFRLANRDFGAHNLLVDAEFNIVGLIDFDGVLAAPLAVVAQFPHLMGFTRAIPERNETRPAALERLAKVEPQMKQYRDLLALAEIEHGGKEAKPMIADALLSDISYVVEGMQSFALHSEETNNDWKAAFESFLEKTSMDVSAREGDHGAGKYPGSS